MDVQKPNPYAPPEQAGPKPNGVRLRSVSILGILNIVYGGLCFLFNLGSLGLLPGGSGGAVAGTGTDSMATAVLWGWGIAWSSIGLVAAVVLIASGIGLRRSKSQGLKLAIHYAWFYGIVTSLVGVAITAVFGIAPLLGEFQRTREPEWLAETLSLLIVLLLEIGPTLIYSIILLKILRRPAVRESLS